MRLNHSEKVANRTTTNKHKANRLKEEHIFPLHNIKHKEKTCEFLKCLLEIKNSQKYTLEEILYCVGKTLLENDVAEYEKYKTALVLKIDDDVKSEYDLLGSCYQYLVPKFNRLNQGSFYTSQDMIEKIVENLPIDSSDVVFDPACGSGNLLFTSKVSSPHQIYGIDSDPIAVMCCKFNYYLRFGMDAQKPNIFCTDFITFIKNNNEKFAFILCNPPFGASLDVGLLSNKTVETEDSLTYFVEHCALLARKYSMFILPESVTNVKKHDALRKWLLNNTNISSIRSFGANFSGTMFPIVALTIDNENEKADDFLFDEKMVSKSLVYRTPFYYFRPIGQTDEAIINKVFAKKTQSLKGSIFALGIVTGDNKTKIYDEKIEGAEPIITGKEIVPYKVMPTKKWIRYDRKDLQQVAPDACYRAKEKLLYKTVSRDMIFAIDYDERLTLNSANFIIPQNLTISIKCLMALLNSSLYNHLNHILYGENKISRTNLENLPLPTISEHDQNIIESMVVNEKYKELDGFINSLFGLQENLFCQ